MVCHTTSSINRIRNFNDAFLFTRYSAFWLKGHLNCEFADLLVETVVKRDLRSQSFEAFVLGCPLDILLPQTLDTKYQTNITSSALEDVLANH